MVIIITVGGVTIVLVNGERFVCASGDMLDSGLKSGLKTAHAGVVFALKITSWNADETHASAQKKSTFCIPGPAIKALVQPVTDLFVLAVPWSIMIST